MPSLPPPAMLGRAGCPDCNGTGVITGDPPSFGYLLLEKAAANSFWEAPDGQRVVLPNDRQVLSRPCGCVRSFFRKAIQGSK